MPPISIYLQPPIGVVIPKSIDDVIVTVEECRRRDVPILGRGCGTSRAGQTCNVAVVIDFSKYLNRLLSLDVAGKVARVEPDIIRDDLNSAPEQHHLTFGPDPATHQYCTIGGMIGNNSCGVHSVMAGKTVDNIEELDIFTYDDCRMRVGPTSDQELDGIIAAGGQRGLIYRKLRDLRDRYAARVGSESTCVIVLDATARLMHSAPHRALLVIGYPDLFSAGDHAAPIRKYGPIGLEAFQKHVIENMQRKGKAPPGARLLPEGDTWLIAEFGGETPQEAVDRARDAQRKIEAEQKGQLGMKVIDDPSEQHGVWRIREAGVGSSRVPREEEAWPSWEDAAVAPEILGMYLRDFDKLLRKFQYRWIIFGHFGDGCVHCRIIFQLKTPEGVRAYRKVMEEAASKDSRHVGRSPDHRQRLQLPRADCSGRPTASPCTLQRLWRWRCTRMGPTRLRPAGPPGSVGGRLLLPRPRWH